jgi:hypothetical protein
MTINKVMGTEKTDATYLKKLKNMTSNIVVPVEKFLDYLISFKMSSWHMLYMQHIKKFSNRFIL